MYFIKDKEFIRGNVPMTKEDIRMLTICKLNLHQNSKFIDIGCGTGSISIQAAMIAKHGHILSIDKSEEAINIIKKNIQKFAVKNVETVKGDASLIIKDIKDCEYDSIFIGGSSNDLENILDNAIRILKIGGALVLNFITLSNAYKAKEILKNRGFSSSMSLYQVSNCIGDKLMFKANNPVFILSLIKEDYECQNYMV